MLISRESYKYYSAVDSSMAALGLGQNTITEMFANCCKIINEGYYLKDLDLDFIQTISAGGKKRALTGNSDKCLCRFELLELIIRISIRKFQISTIYMCGNINRWYSKNNSRSSRTAYKRILFTNF